MSTGSNSVDPYPVYVGTWTNWSRGRILGGTLTISRRDADLLIAFTAFFVAFVATRVWRIICFAIHRSCSNETPQNAIYHQHQAILRNSSTPEEGIQLLSNVLWASKTSIGRSRPLSTVAVAIVCIFSFTIAGGFSSYISTAIGDEVLVKSMNCGQMPRELLHDHEPVLNAWGAEQTNSAANYAQQCYSNGGGGGGLLECSRFVKKQIIGNIDRKAACPFHTNLCRNRSSNLRIDSGYLSSHDHFGLNSPPDQRILLRNVYHCAPMVTKGYTSQSNTSFGEATLYHYGNFTSPIGVQDYVYAAKSLQTQYSFTISNSSLVSYSNFAIQTNVVNVKGGRVMSNSGFLPIDSIFRGDADIDIHFLSGNGVLFAGPSNDAWYRVATAPVNGSYSGANQSDSASWYLASEPSSPLGCINQYQFCNSVSADRKCGPLTNLRDAVAGVVGLFDTNYADFATNNATTRTAALFTYFAQATSEMSVSRLLVQLGPTSLLSQRYLASGMQYRLETDQWQIDVTHWWDILMSARQETFLSYAYGPTDPAILANRINYTMPELKKLCDSQKMRTTAYGSFSLFALVFILLVGGSLVITSYLLEPVYKYLYKKKGYKKYQHLEWTTNATLQLQRLAHEEVGFGTWSSCTETVPNTKANELLGSLDITNPKHPILQPSCPENSSSNNPESFIELPNTVQDPVQTENASSPTITSSSPQLQPTRPTASPERSTDLPQTHRPIPNSETAEVIVEPQGNNPSTSDTNVAPLEEEGNNVK
ncbi:hypothetical protein F4801DRAFT_605164 [Xylaria longipes]|nr:hypothetical protein F4801DRAFT_605164 [Xylaria longipes]